MTGGLLDDLFMTHRLSLEMAVPFDGSFVPPAPKPDEDPDMKLRACGGHLRQIRFGASGA